MKKEIACAVPDKRSHRTGVSSSSWLAVSNKFKKKPLGRCLINQDMTKFLKSVKPWTKDLHRWNKSIDNIWLSEDLDLYLGKPGMLRCRFPWCQDRMVDRYFWESLVCLDPTRKGWLLDDHIDLWVEYMWHVRTKKSNWAMVSSCFVQLLLQESLPIWYVNGDTYSQPWSAVEQVFMPLNPTGEHWNLAKFDISSGLVTLYDSGDTKSIERRDWYIRTTSCLQLKKPENNPNMSDNVPLEIQYEVLLKLPVKFLLRYRIVCKTWKYTIDSDDFVEAYGVRASEPASFLVTFDQGFVNPNYIRFIDVPFRFTRYPHFSPSLPDIKLNNKAIGSSCGLWCFSSSRIATIWNPCIRKSVGIVIPYWVGNTDLEKIVFGFGVHPVGLDPTLVKIAYPEGGHGPWSVVVYKLSTQQWVVLPQNNVPRETIRLKRSSQACIGNIIYWVASERVTNFQGIYFKKYMIMSFDISQFHFQIIDIPNALQNLLPIPFRISKFQNRLVIVGNFIGAIRNTFAGRVLDINGGQITSFNNLYKIDTHDNCKLLGFTNTGEPIVEARSPSNDSFSLKVYQHFIQQFRNLGLEGDGGSFYMSPYHESLIMATEHDGVIYWETLPKVMALCKIFDKKRIDPNSYRITFIIADNVPKQSGVFGDCGVWVCIFFISVGTWIIIRS